MSLRPLAACLGLLALAVPAPAQVGEEVTPKTGSVSWYDERDGKMVPGGTFDTLGATLVKAAPEYYLVRWRGLQGWVKRDEVLVGAPRDAYFSDRLRRDPSDAHAWRYCAQGLQRVGRINEALTAIDEAIRLRPNDALAHQVRSILLCLGRQDFKGSLDELSAAVRIDPANSDTALLRAGVWAAQRDYSSALAEFDRALRLAPTDENIYQLRAQCWRLQGDYVKAVADLDAALRVWPDFLLAHVRRATWLSSPDLAVYNPKEAVVSARRACELTHWEDLPQLRLLARVCELAGDEDGARNCRQKVEELRRADADKLPPLSPPPVLPPAKP